MSFKTTKLVGIILAVILLGTLVGCGGNQGQQQEDKQQETAVPVETVTAQKGTLASYTTVVGQAKPINKVQVTPQVQGRVAAVKVEVGDQVTAGQKLVQLDKEDLQIQVDQAQANVEVAQANLDKVQADPQEEKLAQLKAQVEQAEANYEQAKKNYQRQQKLFEKDVISEQQLEASESQYIAAKSGYQSAKENLKMVKKGATEEQIKSIKAQVKQAKVGLRSAQSRLAKTEVEAPIAGIVSQVNVEAGEVAAQQPVVSLLQLEQMKIMTYVSERHINQLEQGEQVKITFSALEETYQGWINTISPEADPRKGKFLVEVVVDNSDRELKSGMYGAVKFQTAVREDKVVLPRTAVLTTADKDYVYLVEDGQAVYQEVTTDVSNEQQVVITEGIKPGDKVIVDGNEQVSRQDKVKVVSRGDQ